MDEVCDRKDVVECYEDLANAVVQQAARDYRRVIRGKKFGSGDYMKKGEKERLIKVFKSDWCYFLSNISGIEILNRLDKEPLKKRKSS